MKETHRVSPPEAIKVRHNRFTQARTEAGACPGGDEVPAFGGAGTGRGLWPPTGMWKARSMTPAMAGAKGSVAGRHSK